MVKNDPNYGKGKKKVEEVYKNRERGRIKGIKEIYKKEKIK